MRRFKEGDIVVLKEKYHNSYLNETNKPYRVKKRPNGEFYINRRGYNEYEYTLSIDPYTSKFRVIVPEDCYE